MPLTDAQVRNAKSNGDKPAKYADGGGLTLIVSQTSKTWMLRYRRDGKETGATLGQYPQVSLAAARRAAQEAKAARKEGIDPVLQKRRDKAKSQMIEGETFRAVADSYMKAHPNWAESHAIRFRRYIEGDANVLIGGQHVAQITSLDILSVAQRLQARGAANSAKRIIGMIGDVMGHALVLV